MIQYRLYSADSNTTLLQYKMQSAVGVGSVFLFKAFLCSGKQEKSDTQVNPKLQQNNQSSELVRIFHLERW